MSFRGVGLSSRLSFQICPARRTAVRCCLGAATPVISTSALTGNEQARAVLGFVLTLASVGSMGGVAQKKSKIGSVQRDSLFKNA